METKTYMVQIKQEHYEELLERDAWLTAIEDAVNEFDEHGPLEDMLVCALEIYNKRNETIKEPVHLRLIRNIETGNGGSELIDPPSSVQFD